MKRTFAIAALGLLLGAAGCGRSPGTAPVASDPLAEAAWMDGAELRNELDPCLGAIWYLTDPATGTRLQLDVDETQRTGTTCPP